MIRKMTNELDELFGAVFAAFVILCGVVLVVGVVVVMGGSLYMIWESGRYAREGILAFVAIWVGLAAWLRWS